MPRADDRRTWALYLCAMTVGVGALLLTPFRPDAVLTFIARRAPLPGPLAELNRGDLWWTLEDLTNVVLFVPFGFVLTRVLGRGLLGAGAGFLASAVVETAQLFIPGRDGSVLDVACNTAGAVIGAACAARAKPGSAVARPGPAAARPPFSSEPDRPTGP